MQTKLSAAKSFSDHIRNLAAGGADLGDHPEEALATAGVVAPKR
jgi:hypothetical protein